MTHADAATSDIELVVLDMAGTTVVDDGLVELAFERAAERTGVADALGWDAALRYVRVTMGQSKIEVFRHLAAHDEVRAQEAAAAFEDAYAELMSDVGVQPVPGARRALSELRATGKKVYLTTGFSPVTRDAILDALGWRDLVDGALSPADAGRGRPFPDMVLAAMLAARVSSVAAVVVVGDTASDVRSGRAAGAGLVIGVLSGAHNATTLAAAGADIVIDDVTALTDALSALGR